MAFRETRQVCSTCRVSEMRALPLALDALQGMAELLAKQKQIEHAIELATLVRQHPSSEKRTQDRAVRLLAGFCFSPTERRDKWSGKKAECDTTNVAESPISNAARNHDASGLFWLSQNPPFFRCAKRETQLYC
jgi:hypothetical protein